MIISENLLGATAAATFLLESTGSTTIRGTPGNLSTASPLRLNSPSTSTTTGGFHLAAALTVDLKLP